MTLKNTLHPIINFSPEISVHASTSRSAHGLHANHCKCTPGGVTKNHDGHE